jgi:integrase
MPIDTSIYRNIEPVQMPDPMESYGRALSLKSLIDRGQMNAITLREHEQKLRERQQDEADDEKVRQAFGELKGDIAKLPEKVAGKVSQKRQLAIIKQVDDWRKENQTIGKDELAIRKSQAERFGSIAASVKDEPSLRRAVGTALAEKLIGPDQAAEWNARPWDDNTKAAIAQLAQQGMSVAEIHAAGIKDLESRQKTEKHETELPGVQAKTAQEIRENVATQLAAAARKGKEEYHRVRGKLSYDVARQFPEDWTDQTGDEVLRLGMTPAQEATAARGQRPVVQGTEQGTYLIDPGTGKSVEAKTPAGQPIRRQPGAPRTPEGLTVGEEKRRFDTGMAEQEKLQAQEQEQHRARVALGRAIKQNDEKKEGEEFIGADGVKYTAGPDTKRALQTKFEGITKKVTELRTRQKKIREQFKVGEFSAPGQRQAVPIDQIMTGGAEAVPSGSPAAAPAAAPSAPSGQRIRVKLADGRTGTIDAAQFDPKTMTKL